MKPAYNYTLVERHKQKIYIPYVGFEFSGWSIVIGMLMGVLIGLPILGFPLSFLFGDFGYVIAVGITGFGDARITLLHRFSFCGDATGIVSAASSICKEILVRRKVQKNSDKVSQKKIFFLLFF